MMASTPLISTGAGTTTLPLPIAVLIIFITLTPPLLFVLFRHGRRGLLGWYILLAFCGVRIAGAALQIHGIASHSANLTTSLILSNIGLSPLLLGSQGILHEARLARAEARTINIRTEWIKVLGFHIAVIGGMVLLIIGVVHAIDALQPGKAVYTSNGLMKAGVLILLACGVALAVMVVTSLKQASSDRDGTILLHALLLALPLLATRDVYSTLTTFISASSFKNNLAAKVILSTVPEMVIVVIYVIAGIRTRHILSTETKADPSAGEVGLKTSADSRVRNKQKRVSWEVGGAGVTTCPLENAGVAHTSSSHMHLPIRKSSS